MTGKQRAQFRAQANSLEAIVRVGKAGVTPALIQQTDEALEARELIKVKVLLDSSPVSPAEIAKVLGEATLSEVIQVIGGTIVLYRPKQEKDEKASKKPSKAKVKPLAKKKAAVLKRTGTEKRTGAQRSQNESKRPAAPGRRDTAAAPHARPARRTGTPRLSRGGRHQ